MQPEFSLISGLGILYKNCYLGLLGFCLSIFVRIKAGSWDMKINISDINKLLIDDLAFAFISMYYLIEENDITVLNFIPTNNLLNASFNLTWLISIQNSEMTRLGLSKTSRQKKILLSNEVGLQHLMCARLFIIYFIRLYWQKLTILSVVSASNFSWSYLWPKTSRNALPILFGLDHLQKFIITILIWNEIVIP